MSLVAYDSSDESEEEETTKKISVVQKKRKESVKIRIPSLKEFEEDEQTPAPKKPKLQSGSGLFSLLPPPKNTPSFSKPGFTPHILSSKKKHSPSTSQETQNGINTKIISTSTVISENQESDEEISFEKDKSLEGSANVSTHNDFFWLDDLASNDKSKQGSEGSIIPFENNNFLQSISPQISSTLNNNIQQKESKEVTYFHQPSETNIVQSKEKIEPSTSPVEQSYPFGNYSAAESVNELDTRESLLNDKEFLKLQGHKRELENIDIIDVNADDQLTERKEWLMKSLTEESTYRPSRKKHNMPTQQQKRKHQITYLAFQAKERENDLKNQWSLNSRTRRETQAKYGF